MKSLLEHHSQVILETSKGVHGFIYLLMINLRHYGLLFHSFSCFFQTLLSSSCSCESLNLTESELPVLKAVTKTLNSHTMMNLGDVFKQQICPLEEVVHPSEHPQIREEE